MTNEILTQQELKRQLHYDPLTGLFSKSGHSDKNGYLIIVIKGKTYKSHRLAWLYVHGEWPKNQIDHINCLVQDNRIENLRQATNAQNCQNQKNIRINNKSGYKGVYWHKASGKWAAGICKSMKIIHIGLFNTAIEASQAYLELKAKLHFA
jgi:HNH endonuclease/AP2 domain